MRHRHPAYRLDHETARAIRSSQAAGRGVRALARDHGVSLPTVRAVLRYDRYGPALSDTQQTALAAAARRLGETRDEALDIVFARGLAVVRRAEGTVCGSVSRGVEFSDDRIADLRRLLDLVRILLDHHDATRQPEDTIEHRTLTALEEFERSVPTDR